jgi:integrase
VARRTPTDGDQPRPLEVRTATGTFAVSAGGLTGAPIPMPESATPDRFEPFFRVALTLMILVPGSSGAAIRGAARRWHEAVQFWGVLVVDWRVVVAYIVARSAPPVGVEVPPLCQRPVLPTTTAGDLDCLRRGSVLGVEGLGQYRLAFEDERVSLLLRSIGGRVRRLKTAKRALLWSEVQATWDAARTASSPTTVRDAFALVVAFVFACRVRELTGFVCEDLDLVQLSDGRDAIRLRFLRTKTRQSVFASHEPFYVTSAHPTVLEAFDTFNETIKFHDGEPIFHRLCGRTRDSLSRDWFAGVVRRASPNSTPHSTRVGCATEMWAAGASVEEIMAVGRWTSPAAILYILGALEDQVEASDRIGSGQLMYTSAGLQRSLGVSLGRPLAATASVEAWGNIARAVAAQAEE